MPLDPKLLESCTTEALVKAALGLIEENRKLCGTPEYTLEHELLLTFTCGQISALCDLFVNLYNQLENVHQASVEAVNKLSEYSGERDTAITALLDRVETLEARLAHH